MRKRAAPEKLGDYEADFVVEDEEPVKRARQPKPEREKQPKVKQPKVKVMPMGPEYTEQEQRLLDKYGAIKFLAGSLRGVGGRRDPKEKRDAEEDAAATAAFVEALKAAESGGDGGAAQPMQQAGRGLKRHKPGPSVPGLPHQRPSSGDGAPSMVPSSAAAAAAAAAARADGAREST